jgi:hypothetical protein
MDAPIDWWLHKYGCGAITMNEMSIESARYIADLISGENVSIKATIDGITMSVPLDPANRHYAEIMRQVEAGELVIQEADSGSE